MRQARIVEAQAPHHVILRGNNRRRLFSFTADYVRFLDYLATACERHRVELHHLCLMQNHVHLVVTPPTERSLGQWVHTFAQRYAQHRNRTREGSGKLFEERFRSFPVLDEPYLAAVTAYVELNPVRAGRCRAPEDFVWSTYRLLIGETSESRIPAAMWTPSSWYLEFGRTPAERAHRFRTWMEEYAAHQLVTLPEQHRAAIVRADHASAEYPRRLRRPDGRRLPEAPRLPPRQPRPAPVIDWRPRALLPVWPQRNDIFPFPPAPLEAPARQARRTLTLPVAAEMLAAGENDATPEAILGDDGFSSCPDVSDYTEPESVRSTRPESSAVQDSYREDPVPTGSRRRG